MQTGRQTVPVDGAGYYGHRSMKSAHSFVGRYISGDVLFIDQKECGFYGACSGR
jgi:hypothetical protein